MANTTRFHPPARLTPPSVWRPLLTTVSLGMALLWPAGATLAANAAPPAASGSPAWQGGINNSTTTGNSNSSPRAPRPLLGCLMGPERVADVGSPVVGVVSAMKVDRGDLVSAGDTLVLLDSGVEAASVEAASARSAMDADVRAAEANATLATQRHTRTVSLVAEGFVTTLAAEQARAERDVALQKLAQARGQRTVQRRELGQVQAQLAQRTVRSPFRGVVVERFVNAGERVDDKPLLRLAMLDPLRVELVLPANRWGSVARGDAISVLPELPGATAVVARVTHVDKVIDATSNTFRVRLSLPNPGDKLPAGARCKVDGGLSAAVADTPATPKPKADASLPPQLTPAAARAPAAARPARPLLAIAQTAGLRPHDHPTEARTAAERQAALAEQSAAAAALSRARERRPALSAAAFIPDWLRLAVWGGGVETAPEPAQRVSLAP